ncbi:MAG: hypothetical protein HC920_11075 [Oscillatoriales cyanobacterium SM2_3_0]|nr:hypothetical protein [Oscillatoriales cyanobacterium SM2_3_0]
MSLANSSALSCIATAVGCAVTGMVLSEKLTQANPEPLSDDTIQQSRPKTADELMAEAAQGLKQSVTPPGTLPIQSFSSAPQTAAVEDLGPNPLDAPKPSEMLTARLPPMPQSVASRVTQLEEKLQFLPDYLNFDAEPEPKATRPESAAIATTEFRESDALNPTVISYIPEDLAVEPVPLHPPGLSVSQNAAEYAAQYIVEPTVEPGSAISAVKPQAATPEPEVAQYIVDPQEVITTKKRPAPPRLNSRVNPVQSGAPVSPIIDPVLESYPKTHEQTHSQLPDKTVTVASTPFSQPSSVDANVHPKPMPSLLKKLVEANNSSSDIMNDIKGTTPVSSSGSNAVIESKQASPTFVQVSETSQSIHQPTFKSVDPAKF